MRDLLHACSVALAWLFNDSIVSVFADHTPVPVWVGLRVACQADCASRLAAVRFDHPIANGTVDP